MSFLLLVFFLINKIEASVHTNVVHLPNNTRITTKSANFKKNENVRLYYYVRIASFSMGSTIECGARCITTPHCWGFSVFKEGLPLRCDFFKGNLNTEHYYVKADVIRYDFYEMQNACTLNPLICEHGSVCIPNFINNTYHCKWCFPPYSGKHCNLIDGVLSNMPIPSDILSGKRISCRSLKTHFGPLTNSRYDIHPWRDHRKINVECTIGGSTFLMKIKSWRNGENFTTLTTLTNLLPNQRITTSVLNLFYKLTRFEQLSFLCYGVGKPYKYLQTAYEKTPLLVNVLKYFIGESNVLPTFCDTQTNNLDIAPCQMYSNKTWSSDNVPFEFRIFKDIARFGNATLSFGDGSYGCFDKPGQYTGHDYYQVTVL
ncbi:uncharacterized protein LOC130622536 [Hydractinia symbiolongicarpus]|uniref:uncharacterized protein LOC130622536 n=1 Tax=Hydractinia symbiolongicarpus TaxID=13093 RepID=UPI00254F25C8|nr:uncharacterized protein LOC130622536 [Hydractinia symbiolongicarpus]